MSSATGPPTVLCVYGTRPEAVKMAPLIRALQAAPDLGVSVVVTGQHREMARQVEQTFGIEPDLDLDLFQHGQELHELTARVLLALTPVVNRLAPHAVVVQGDTTTALGSALSAFYAHVPVVHLEAGLRSGDLATPYPEEGNRLLIARLAALHLAPTTANRANLEREGVPPDRIAVTGNTVIDALQQIVGADADLTDAAVDAFLHAYPVTVLLTTHRRESWGGPMAESLTSVADLVDRHPDLGVVFPVHANPTVRTLATRHLGGRSNVLITDALSYPDFCRAMAMCSIVITDSGGVQEEAPSLGKPVLVLRDLTERDEALHDGMVQLVGTNRERILTAAEELVTRAREGVTWPATSPFGDGHAAERGVAAIRSMLTGSAMPAGYSG
jgi:UDP-N-acetylglucosamine 2-epimerase (non-hydrolysing)